MLLLGYDLGTSSVKASLVDSTSNQTIAVAQHPEQEMRLMAPENGWAEQYPEEWWKNITAVTHKVLKKSGYKGTDVKAIGIAYQMHGLVLVDENHNVLRPSIIWCDSRAVNIGDQAFEEIGEEYCLESLLNSPGNFTASKLKWVKDNEPDVYRRIHKIMLPGDYIAMKLTGRITTTPSGLSEGIFWNYPEHNLSREVLAYFGFEETLIPEIVPNTGIAAGISSGVADELGLSKDAVIAYRAGDQPNNALSLNVMKPGEVAATGGTSGVVYGVTDQMKYDPQSRVNAFAHVNHTREDPRIGILLCINGAGRLYSWLRNELGFSDKSYDELEQAAQSVDAGAGGVSVIPFGNGAERMLKNVETGCHFHNLQLNQHSYPHMVRATLEGIAFAFVYGMEIMKSMDMPLQVIRAGNDNMFQSAVFTNTIAELTGATIELLESTGATGAAIGAGIGAGYYDNPEQGLGELNIAKVYQPSGKNIQAYQKAYQQWKYHLKQHLK